MTTRIDDAVESVIDRPLCNQPCDLMVIGQKIAKDESNSCAELVQLGRQLKPQHSVGFRASYIEPALIKSDTKSNNSTCEVPVRNDAAGGVESPTIPTRKSNVPGGDRGNIDTKLIECLQKDSFAPFCRVECSHTAERIVVPPSSKPGMR